MLKKYILDEHYWNCPCHPEHPKNPKNYDYDQLDEWTQSMMLHCDLRPTQFLFYFLGDFHLVTYFRCMEKYDHLGAKEDMVGWVVKQSKHIYEYHGYVNRGRYAEKELKEFRLYQKALKKYWREVNYVYSDNAGKEFCIYTTIPFVDAIHDRMDWYKKMREVEAELKELDEPYLINQFDALCVANYQCAVNDTELVKSIDTLRMQISKQLNQV